MATEQRAFAAVWVSPRGTLRVVPDTVRFYAADARKAAAAIWQDGWEGAKRQGWRIRPVIINLEEQDNG